MSMPQHLRRGRLWQLASRTGHDTGRQRPVLRWAYERAVALETGIADLLHGRRAGGPVDPGNVTLVVKTFERPAVLQRMLRSVRRVYAGPIIVADDSAREFRTEDASVRVLRLPFDSGIGVGRNALLDAVETEFVFMADDDMHLLPDFDVQRPIDYLQRNPEVDLCGGRVIHLPLWRTADYSGARLFAYRGEPRVREGVVIDGLPVTYKAPNFYVARTEQVRAVRYDDRLKRQDHNDFFTSAFGQLVCVIDRRMVCLHAHSFFDVHYQSFRMNTGADHAYLSAKWGGPSDEVGDDRGPTASQLIALHHAAIETVASDLGVRITHQSTPTDASVTVRVPENGQDALGDTLRTLGWAGSGKRLTHPLWGELRLVTGSTEATGDPASFAMVNGYADGSDWPGPVTRDEHDGPRIRLHPRAGWVDDGESVVGAALPLGPVRRLEFPGDLIWEVIGPSGKPREQVIAEVLAAFEDPPADAAAQVAQFLDRLEEQGLLDAAD